MCAYQDKKHLVNDHKMLATTIAESVVISEVNQVKQPLPLCYPHNVSECYWCDALIVKDCRQGEWGFFTRLFNNIYRVLYVS